MTEIVSDSKYCYIRKKLREKYFNQDGFVKLTDITEFNEYLNNRHNGYLGRIPEDFFLAHYLANPDYNPNYNFKLGLSIASTDMLSTILYNSKICINPKANIVAVYKYLEELNQYKLIEWYTNEFEPIFDLFNKYKESLLANATLNNNQQVWI